MLELWNLILIHRMLLQYLNLQRIQICLYLHTVSSGHLVFKRISPKRRFTGGCFILEIFLNPIHHKFAKEEIRVSFTVLFIKLTEFIDIQMKVSRRKFGLNAPRDKIHFKKINGNSRRKFSNNTVLFHVQSSGTITMENK